jgi:hypothetical protein
MLHTLPYYVRRPYLATADSVVRCDFFSVFVVISPDVRTRDQINCATRHLSPSGVWGAQRAVASARCRTIPFRFIRWDHRQAY